MSRSPRKSHVADREITGLVCSRETESCGRAIFRGNTEPATSPDAEESTLGVVGNLGSSGRWGPCLNVLEDPSLHREHYVILFVLKNAE